MHESNGLARRGAARFAAACGGLGLAATLAGGPVVAGAEPEPAIPMETWESPALGLRLTPPLGWARQEGPAPGGLVMVPPGGAGQVALMSLPAPAPEHGSGGELGPLVDAAVASLRQRIEHFKLLARRDSRVAGLPAAEIYFRGKVGDKKFRWVQTLFLRRDHQVIVMYAAPDERFDQFLGDYDQILRSARALP
jgi:hypothetical protein